VRIATTCTPVSLRFRCRRRDRGRDQDSDHLFSL